jgi:hypothetical protein
MLRLCALTVFCICTVVHCTQYPLIDESSPIKDVYLSRAEKLMKQTPMIDGHNVPLPRHLTEIDVGFTNVTPICKE